MLDKEFPWDLHKLRQDIFSLVGHYEVPVIFCDTCEANAILLALGEEEEEFMIPIHGYYHPKRRFIFVFVWEDYEQLLNTLLHEIRHDMQFKHSLVHQLFHEERYLPYEERWIERDARAFVKKMMMQYVQKKA